MHFKALTITCLHVMIEYCRIRLPIRNLCFFTFREQVAPVLCTRVNYRAASTENL